MDDAQRLEALRQSGLLDTPSEEASDRLTRLVTRLLGVPAALVSLVDRDRRFFRGCAGVPEPWATTRETPRSRSVRQHPVVTSDGYVLDSCCAIDTKPRRWMELELRRRDVLCLPTAHASRATAAASFAAASEQHHT